MPVTTEQVPASRGARHALLEVADADDELESPPGRRFLDHREGEEDGEGETGWRRRILAALADHVPPTLRGARWRLSVRSAASVVIGLVLAVFATFLVAQGDAPELITPGTAAVSTPAQPAPDQPASTGSAMTTPPAVLVVHVAGLVAEPGVLELPIGSRVIDAIEAAGGALTGVDLSGLNLARLLVDGEQVAVGVPAAPDAGGDGGGSATLAPGAPLDLNTATEADLDALPGIGPVLAARIVAWRAEHGRFTAVEELLEVSGIGTATLADLNGLVRV